MGFSAPDPIGWADLDAYTRLRAEPLEPWEAEAVRAMDDTFLAEVAKKEGGDA